MVARFASISVLVLFSSLSYAQQQQDDAQDSIEVLNELFLSDTASSQDEGEWQISVIPQYGKNERGKQFSVPVEIEYGITDQLQVEFEYTPYIKVDNDSEGSQSGNGNVEVGFQYSWPDFNDSGLTIALLYSHEFAEGDREVIGEAGEDLDDEDNISIVIARAIKGNGSTQAFIQIGNELEGSENEAYINLGIYGQFHSYVLSGELNWSDDQSFITPGITWKVADGWEFGVGTAIGIEGEEDIKVISNMLYEWE